jgi:arabinogalactan endo-1,4-beta-galactosidase
MSTLRFVLCLPFVAVLLGFGGSDDKRTLANADFEDGGSATQTPPGWSSTGTTSADFTEAGGRNSAFRLSHWSAQPFEVETSQTLRGLPNGVYRLSAWVRRSTGTNNSYIELRNCGEGPGDDARAYVPPQSGWLNIVVSARVHGTCTVVLHTDAEGGQWSNFDGISFGPGAPATIGILGADVSSLLKSEAKGGIYRDRTGAPADALAVLRQEGLNWIRARVWVDSADDFHELDELLRLAQRADAAGLKLLVDLHYSDFWADPGKQWTPAAWVGQTFPELKNTFVAYTRDVITSLVAQGTPPAMVQLGNEINPGMLWDYAATWTGTSCADDGMGGTRCEFHNENWGQLAELLTAGYATVKSASPTTKVMLHLAEGGSNGTFTWWFGNITTRNVPFDVIGASFYGYWHGSLAQLQFNLNDVAARYDKDIVVAETAYPFTLADDDGWENIIDTPGELVAGYPATPAGQAAWVRDILSIVRAVPDNRGLGIFYWDATWTGVPGNGWSPRDPSSGNAWENQALFDYDDRPLLPALSQFRP